MKILITGGAGFIGLHLAEKLHSAGNSIDLLDNFARGAKDDFLETFIAKDNVRIFEADLLDPTSLDTMDLDYDVIFHFAAILGVAHVLQRPYEVLTKNVDLLSNVITFAKKQKALKRFVFTSTSEVYAGTLRFFDMAIPTPESTPLAITPTVEPRTSYMLSKIYGEAMCEHSGLPYAIVRPHNVYGPRMGMSHVVPQLLEKALNLETGKPLEVYSPSHRRTFCYINDATDLMVDAAMSDACEGQTINLGSSDNEITIETLAAIILDTVGKSDNGMKFMPETEGSVSRRCPDMTLAGELSGYQSKIDVRTGVQKTFDWYAENIFSGRIKSAT